MPPTLVQAAGVHVAVHALEGKQINKRAQLSYVWMGNTLGPQEK